MITTAKKLIDALLVSTETNVAFWGLLVSVGLVALLFGLKLVLSDRDERKFRRHQ